MTSWLPDLAELDLNFLVRSFHGTPNYIDGEMTGPSFQNLLSHTFLILGSGLLMCGSSSTF